MHRVALAESRRSFVRASRRDTSRRISLGGSRGGERAQPSMSICVLYHVKLCSWCCGVLVGARGCEPWCLGVSADRSRGFSGTACVSVSSNCMVVRGELAWATPPVRPLIFPWWNGRDAGRFYPKEGGYSRYRLPLALRKLATTLPGLMALTRVQCRGAAGHLRWRAGEHASLDDRERSCHGRCQHLHVCAAGRRGHLGW